MAKRQQITCPFLKEGLRHIDCWAQRPDPLVCIHTRVGVTADKLKKSLDPLMRMGIRPETRNGYANGHAEHLELQ